METMPWNILRNIFEHALVFIPCRSFKKSEFSKKVKETMHKKNIVKVVSISY